MSTSKSPSSKSPSPAKRNNQAKPRRERAAPLSNPQERHRQILEIAARIIREKGFEAASMNEITAACGLTKGGLYHHIRSKEHLLLEIMHYGMDLFEEEVLAKVLAIADPVERLKECMARNIRLVADHRSKEVTIILHEHATLTGEALVQINARKKRYVRFVESSIAEAIRDGRFRPVDPKVAAFSFLGTILWLYKWYRPDGEISKERLAEQMTDLFFRGLEAPPRQKTGPTRIAVLREEGGAS